MGIHVVAHADKLELYYDVGVFNVLPCIFIPVWAVACLKL